MSPMRIDLSRGEKGGKEPHRYLGRMFQAERRASVKLQKGKCIWPTGGTQRGQFGWSKTSGKVITTERLSEPEHTGPRDSS